MKPKPDVIAEHDAAQKEFEAQGEPAAYICFVWPDLHRWQAIAGYDSHREDIPRVRTLLTEARVGYGQKAPTADTMLGDCLNALAELTLRAVDNPQMGAMSLFVSKLTGYRYILATVNRSALRDSSVGSLTTVEPLTATNVLEARAAVDAHPTIIAAKLALMNDVLTGAKH